MQRKQSNEKGALTAEAAIAAPIAFLLIFMLLCAALVGRTTQATRYGSTAGARAGGVAGIAADADRDVLRGIARAALVGGKDQITRIVVFKAAGPKSPVPPACLVSAQAGLCNVYTGDDFDVPKEDFGPGQWEKDDHWPSYTRVVSRAAGADYIGVYVEAETGVPFGPLPKTLRDTAVVRLEASAN